MKKFAIALMAGLMLVGGARVVQAHEECEKCGYGRSGAMTPEKMALLLDLDAKQQAAIKDLVDARHNKMEAAEEQEEAAGKAAHADFDAGLKKVLSDKQEAKLDAWLKAEEGGECERK